MKRSTRLGSSSLQILAAIALAATSTACGSTASDGSGDQTGGATAGGGGDDDGGASADGSGGGANGGGGGDDASPPPFSPDASLEGITTVPLVACDGLVYGAPVTVGSQNFQSVIDTGSTSFGLAGTGCANCQVTPLYTPGSSATDQHQTAQAQFGSGDWTGEIYEDSVGFKSAASVPMKLVAITSQNQILGNGTCGGQPYQGLMGFGPAVSAVQGTDAFFDQLVAANKSGNVFATELCDNTGSLWLGGYDQSHATAAPQYTPMLTGFLGSGYYSVDFNSIIIDGKTIAVSSTQYKDSVVDTGTSVLLLGSTAYNAVTAALSANATFKSLFGANFFSGGQGGSGCVQVNKTKAELDATLPPLSLVFGSNPSITVQAAPTESYLAGYGGTWCAAMDSAPQSAGFPLASIMGASLLRSNIVIFDRANNRVGFAPHKGCSGVNAISMSDHRPPAKNVPRHYPGIQAAR